MNKYLYTNSSLTNTYLAKSKNRISTLLNTAALKS